MGETVPPLKAAENALDALKPLRERLAVAADAGYRVAHKTPESEYIADLGFRLIQANAKVLELEAQIALQIQGPDKETAARLTRKVQALAGAVASVEELVAGGAEGVRERRGRRGER